MLVADVYAPEKARATALFLPGFPATLGENEVTRALVNNGLTVVCPHYRGTYDSGGRFTPLTAVQTVKQISSAVRQGLILDTKRNTRAPIPPAIVVAVGYSFGAYVLLHAARSLTDLQRVWLFSPALTYGPAPLDSGFQEEGIGFLDYVRRSRPRTYRLGKEEEWRRFYEGDFNAAPGRPSRAEVTVESYFGQKDSSFDAAVLGKNHDPIVRQFFPHARSIKLHQITDGSHGIDTLAAGFRPPALNEAW
jgi:dienelactone hydrolase